MVVHIDEFGHLPNWNGVKILHNGLEKKKRRLTEAAYIISNRSTNHRDGFFRLAEGAARTIIKEAGGEESGSVAQPTPRNRLRPGNRDPG